MKSVVQNIIGGLMVSTGVVASPCDNLPIIITGPAHFQHSIYLSQGTLGEKETGVKTIQDKAVNPNGSSYAVFSGKGTWGNVRGTITIVDTETSANTSIAFSFYKDVSQCRVSPASLYIDKNHFQIQAKGMRNHALTLSIKEFK